MSDLIFTFEDGSEYLCHYGVLGMKWGVRKEEKRNAKRLGKAQKYDAKAKSASTPYKKLQYQRRRDLQRELVKPGSTKLDKNIVKTYQKRNNIKSAVATGASILGGAGAATSGYIYGANALKLATTVGAKYLAKTGAMVAMPALQAAVFSPAGAAAVGLALGSVGAYKLARNARDRANRYRDSANRK